MLSEFLASSSRSDRHGYDNALGQLEPHGARGGEHRCARGQPIVHQDHCATGDRQCRSALAIDTFTTPELPLLACRYAINNSLRETQLSDESFVQYPYAAACDGTH